MSNRRDYTTLELAEMFPDKKVMTCPECKTTKFHPGPEGGNSQNFKCENGHTWNCNAFGMQAIGPGLEWAARQGWGRPSTRSRANLHYFRDRHSLCGKYIDRGPLHMSIVETHGLADGQCVRCARKL